MTEPASGSAPESHKRIRRGRADIHIHSAVGDALPTIEQILEYAEHRTTLDLIAITDHDELKGAEKACELAAQRGYRVQVMMGCEITTLDGHLLALDIEKPVRMLQSLEKSIEAVHRQGGLCIVPHPLSWLTPSVGLRVMMRVFHSSSPWIYFNGIELFNPSIAGRVAHRKARTLNRGLLHLAETGGSDAHMLPLIGTGVTFFEGSTADDFRRSLQEGRTKGWGRFWKADAQMDGLAALQFQSLVVHPVRKVRRALGGVLRGNRSVTPKNGA